MAKPPVLNSVPTEDLATFDACMAKWQRVLNLSDWRIERSSKRFSNMAEVVFDNGARLACYKVGRSFGDAPVNAQTIDETALHEPLHILLHDLTQADEASLEGVEHRVINVLEKLLLKGCNAA